MHSLYGLRGLLRLYGLRPAFYHDRCDHCRVQFTHVVYGCANLEGQKKLLRKQKRSNPIGFASNTKMATDHTFQITINFEQRYMDIHGSQERSISNFRHLKRKPLSLIFNLAFSIIKFKIS